MQPRTLEVLAQLVACDTQNPPRHIHAESEIFRCVQRWLGDDFEFTVRDFGEGRVNLLARRGHAGRLFNVHLDTVPAGHGWKRPPFQLTEDSGRVYGRGVCDIKGAAACLIDAARSTNADVALLFSSDEEGSASCCIREFCMSPLARPCESFVVAEPTGCRAVTGHRGYLSVTGEFRGAAGHTSQPQRLAASANHRAVHWMAAALQSVAEFEAEELQGHSACFNIGRMDGGIKNNMVADQCRISWSARLPAGCANQSLLQRLCGEAWQHVRWEITFDGSPLPANPRLQAETDRLCRQENLPVAGDVDFWTEAAIFASTGRPTLVLGPGNIAQAHTADEWVEVAQLQRCRQLYLQLMQPARQRSSKGMSSTP
jgi:acetylornithine deacetylase